MSVHRHDALEYEQVMQGYGVMAGGPLEVGIPRGLNAEEGRMATAPLPPGAKVM